MSQKATLKRLEQLAGRRRWPPPANIDARLDAMTDAELDAELARWLEVLRTLDDAGALGQVLQDEALDAALELLRMSEL